MGKHKFIHCADLHLGCNPNHLEARYNDFFDSFKDLIDKAIIENCEYMIISGDLFHLKVINSKTLLNVINLLEYAKNNNIKIFVIEGNHDKAFFEDTESWLIFLEAKGYITLLKHSIENSQIKITNDSIYEDENIRIIGIGYLGSATSIYLKGIENKISKSDKFTILMLHGAINRLSGQDLGDFNINILTPLQGIVDYVALGHIHYKYAYEDFCFNPGALENIRIKEGKKSDQKGYYIVEFNENKEKVVNFHISKKRKIYNETIKLENEESIFEVKKIIKNKEFNCEKDSILEITIYGNVPFNPYLINFEEIKQYFKEKYELLYVDINNLINIVTQEQSTDSIIDIKLIESEAITNYLDQNHPYITNSNEFTKKILDVKTSLIEKTDLNTIIKSMVDEGDIL